tara:strand:+ start:8461 stop:10443 length:1983 start_codon:yes stop_codon:yes gene_type:complete
MIINSENISVVVQGAVEKEVTLFCIQSIRKYLPNSELILSTWSGSDVSKLDYDHVIFNHDPQAAYCTRNKQKNNNLNRLILSTKSGLSKASKKYVLKLRSDLILTSDRFLSYFNKFQSRVNKYAIFSERILTGALFSRENIILNKNDLHYIPFAPSDWWFFGFTTDVQKYLNVNEVNEPGFSQYFQFKPIVEPEYIWKFSPEQYVGSQLLRCLDSDYEIKDTFSYDIGLIDLSRKVLTNNFVFLGYKESGIFMEKFLPYSKDERLLDFKQYNGLITYFRFLQNYKRYCDSNYSIDKEVLEYYLPKEENKCSFDCNPINIPVEADNISVVVQGPIDKKLTSKCLLSIRKSLPGAEIVLSTWKNSDTSKLNYDKVVFSSDPKCFPYSEKPDAKNNNVNRQIVSTINGLREATRPYTLKMRTDFILKDNLFLEYFNKFPKYEINFRVFDNKIINLSYFSRNPRNVRLSYPFHPSDIALFGTTDDLYKFFDIPLMQKSDSAYLGFSHSKFKYNRFVPEQHLFVNCLWRNGHIIDFKHQRDSREEVLKSSERYFASNFIFLNFDEFNLQPPQRFENHYSNDYKSCITHVEWQKLYHEYIDPKFVPQIEDFERERLEKMFTGSYISKFIGKLCACIFVGKPLRQFRRKIRSMVRIFLDKKIFGKIY